MKPCHRPTHWLNEWILDRTIRIKRRKCFHCSFLDGSQRKDGGSTLTYANVPGIGFSLCQILYNPLEKLSILPLIRLTLLGNFLSQDLNFVRLLIVTWFLIVKLLADNLGLNFYGPPRPRYSRIANRKLWTLSVPSFGCFPLLLACISHGKDVSWSFHGALYDLFFFGVRDISLKGIIL